MPAQARAGEGRPSWKELREPVVGALPVRLVIDLRPRGLGVALRTLPPRIGVEWLWRGCAELGLEPGRRRAWEGRAVTASGASISKQPWDVSRMSGLRPQDMGEALSTSLERGGVRCTISSTLRGWPCFFGVDGFDFNF